MKEIEDILDEFDFVKVQETMKALGWKYFDCEGEYPSIAELRRMARMVLISAYGAENSTEYLSSCGGFEATRHMYPGESKKYLSLKFVVAEWNNYD